jgi:hypothetical protein
MVGDWEVLFVLLFEVELECGMFKTSVLVEIKRLQPNGENIRRCVGIK